MRLAISALVLLVGATAQGTVTFVTPQSGGQAIGAQVIEVMTDAVRVDRVEFRVDGVLVGVARTAPFRIVHDFGTSVAARTIEAKVLAGGYRTSEIAEITTAALTAGESMNVDLVEVPMRVRSSRPVTAADIRLLENSVEQPVREILPVRGTAHFAFVVDRSLSMGGGRLAAALDAVAAAKNLLREGDTTSVILFNHHVGRSESLTEPVTPSGGTSLRDAVAFAVPQRATRTYVVVITDGGDRNSVLSEEAALRAISGTRGVISAIVLGDASRFLRRATATTGGTLIAATRDNLRQTTERLLADINSRYTLVYQSSSTAKGWRSIEIAPRRSGLDVLAARKGYFAE